MNRIFACLFGLPTLIVSISVAGQTPDGEAKRFHYLPMLVNGDGFQSTLLVTNVADQANRCNLELLADGLSASSFETHESLTWNGSSATLDLPDSGTRVSISGRDVPRARSIWFGNSRVRHARCRAGAGDPEFGEPAGFGKWGDGGGRFA